MPTRTALPPWTCGICGIHDNWGHKVRCRNCNAYPPASHRNLAKGGKSSGKEPKGKGKGSAPRSDTPGKGNLTLNSHYGNFGTYAYRQLQQARGGSSAQQAQGAYQASFKELQDARRRNEGLQEQNKRLQRELEEAKTVGTRGHGDDDDAMEEGPEDIGEEERKGRMDKLRNSLPYLEETYGTDSSLYIDAAAELDLHQKTLLGAKPYKTHRTILERKLERLRRQQDRDKGRLTELHDAAEEIRVKITSTAASVAERDREIEAAEGELRELVLKAVGEEPAQTPTVPDPTSSWDNVVGAVAQLVKAPGVPPEFTCQLEGMFNQLRGMVTALQSHATAVSAQCGATQTTTAAATAVPIACQPGGAAGTSAPKPNGEAQLPEADRNNDDAHGHVAAHSASSSTSSNQSPPATAMAAAAAPPTTPPAPTTPAAAAAAAPPEAAAGQTIGDGTAPENGVESDGDNVTDQEDMEVEALGAKLSPEQKGSLRAMLSIRKARLARRTMRLKKPAADDGLTSKESKKR